MGGTVAGKFESDMVRYRQACQAPLWRRAISDRPTMAFVTVTGGKAALYRTTIDCTGVGYAILPPGAPVIP